MGTRPAAINVGVRNLDEAIKFYEAVFEVTFKSTPENPNGAQLFFGTPGDPSFFIFNIRERDDSEAHSSHTSAFGFSVDDLGATHRRALAAGANEHFPPTESHGGMPRHSRIEDPSGNRIVVWQG